MKEVENWKKKLLLFGTLVAILSVILMLGLMFWRQAKNKQAVGQSTAETEQANESSEPTAQPAQSEELLPPKRISKLISTPVDGLAIKPGTNLALFYQGGNFLTIDPYTGKRSTLAAYPLGEFRSLEWNREKDKLLVGYGYERGYFIYDLSNNSFKKFRDKIDVAAWNYAGDKIVYKYYNAKSKRRKIRIADLDGANSIVLVNNLPYRKVDFLPKPPTDKICYFPVPDIKLRGHLVCLAPKRDDREEYAGNRGGDYLWSPDGSKLLTSFVKSPVENKLSLAVIEDSLQPAKELGFATTVKKCVWSGDNLHVYCALLGGAPVDLPLPNAWEEKNFYSRDTFWKINTDTGEKERLVEPEDIPEELDVVDLVLDPEENFLFFRNRRDGSLWLLNLRFQEKEE